MCEYAVEKFRSDLVNIAMTTLSSKILSQDKVHFANLAVDAVLRLKVHTRMCKSLVLKILSIICL